MQSSEGRIYLAGSRYTVLSAIALESSYKKEFGGKSLLVIVLENHEIKHIDKIVDLSEYFDEICFLRSPTKSGKYYLVRCLLSHTFLFESIGVSQEFLELISNRSCNFFSQNYIYSVLFRKFISSFYLIDEGLSSYSGRVLNVKYRNPLLRLMDFICLGNIMRPISGIALYQPNLYFGPLIPVFGISSVPILDVAKGFQNLKGQNTCKGEEYPSALFLGTPIRGLDSLVEDGKLTPNNFQHACLIERLVLNNSADTFSSLTYRKHPNQTEADTQFDIDICIDYGDRCWELIIPEVIREDTVIISFFSTAAFVPKLIYGLEPVIVFLYPMLQQKCLGADELVKRLRALYSEPSKVVLIEDLQDYYNLSKRYML